jgi:hypothetical protein
MLFVDRPDGKRIKDLNPFQQVLPYVMPTRNGSAVYFSEDLDVEPALDLVKKLNDEANARKYHLFHVIIAALVQVLLKKDHLNRFISGKAMYQRNYLSTSFIVKKKLTEDARETDAKVYFQNDDTLLTVQEKIDAAVAQARSEELTPDEKEMYVLSRIPGAYRVATAIFKVLDRFNIAPPSMIRSDPLYTSIYVANLASINLSTPYHHLYEWGNASIFFVMGRVERRKVLNEDGTEQERHFMNIKVTLDERISEGLYFARAIDLFRRMLNTPEILLKTADQWDVYHGRPTLKNGNGSPPSEDTTDQVVV